MAIHTGSPLSNKPPLRQNALFSPNSQRTTVKWQQMSKCEDQGRHVLQMLPEQCSLWPSKEPTRRFTLKWALSHVLLVT